MPITSTIKMDLLQPGVTPMVDMVQDDKYSREIVFELYSGGIAWCPPDGATILARFSKPDGTGGEYDTLPDGSAAWAISENAISVRLAPQVTTAPGCVQLAVSVIYGLMEVTTFTVRLIVHHKPGYSAESEDYVNISVFLPQVSEAAVGQFLEVEEVDSGGRITKLKAVDAPSIPAFDLAAMGLAAITPDGPAVLITSLDLTETVAAMEAGPVKFSFLLNAGQEITMAAVANAIAIPAAGQYQWVIHGELNGTTLTGYFQFAASSGTIKAWATTGSGSLLDAEGVLF